MAFKELNYYDHRNFGRCYTIISTPEMISFGIREVDIKVKIDVDVFFHTTGLFETNNEITKFTMKAKKVAAIIIAGI